CRCRLSVRPSLRHNAAFNGAGAVSGAGLEHAAAQWARPDTASLPDPTRRTVTGLTEPPSGRDSLYPRDSAAVPVSRRQRRRLSKLHILRNI
ncbi:unnamed protein product, partial [Pleuronectes platessa]